MARRYVTGNAHKSRRLFYCNLSWPLSQRSMEVTLPDSRNIRSISVSKDHWKSLVLRQIVANFPAKRPVFFYAGLSPKYNVTHVDVLLWTSHVLSKTVGFLIDRKLQFRNFESLGSSRKRFKISQSDSLDTSKTINLATETLGGNVLNETLHNTNELFNNAFDHSW